jgi:tRNA threonylcarbamoyladenosine biosynthesis protein TsaE
MARNGLRDGLASVVDEHVTVTTAAQMRNLGRRLASLLQAGDLVILSGRLGAGKTTLAQGVGAGLGVRGPITSPTFVIARIHPNLGVGPDMVHADAYRLGSRAEVDDLDLDADLATSVTLVEWGDGLVENLAASYLSVEISAESGAGEAGGAEAEPDGIGADEVDAPRSVHLRGWGERWAGAGPALTQP